MKTAHLIINACSFLGEGPCWHHEEERLYWVNIEGREVHRYDPQKEIDEKIDLTGRPGTVVPVKGGGLLVALEDQIARVDFETKHMAKVASLEVNKPHTRSNDGKCDPSGRFWVGTMSFGALPHEGTLYRLDGHFKLVPVLEHVTISNGLVWSLDGRQMYYIDSPTRTLQVFDYHNPTGQISNRKVTIKFPPELGFPDGMTIDEEGMLWVAHFGAFCVVRWNPANGNLIEKIQVPVPKVTSCAFGNRELDTLFITTAREGLKPAEIEKYPESGGVFAVKAPVKGVKSHFFNPVE